MPTLVLVGANDTNFLAATDYMAAKIKGSDEKVVIPDAGHAANLHQPVLLFNQAVEAFLAAAGNLRRENGQSELQSSVSAHWVDMSAAGSPTRARTLP